MVISRIQINSALDKQMQPSDESLVLACRRGEAMAWDMLVMRYQRLIYTVPRRGGLDQDQAAEVFQRTFARLLEHLDRIEQPGRIRAWLVTTARRETLRLIRQHSKERSLSGADDRRDAPGSNADDAYGEMRYESVADDALLPDEVLERLEQQHLVRMAIEALGERCRRLLLLLFYRPEPPPYAEIAAALDMPEGSLGPTRARCLQKVRRLLGDAVL
jgi:RNA polymerase sigma factor (sigma-70 family)